MDAGIWVKAEADRSLQLVPSEVTESPAVPSDCLPTTAQLVELMQLR